MEVMASVFRRVDLITIYSSLSVTANQKGAKKVFLLLISAGQRMYAPLALISVSPRTTPATI